MMRDEARPLLARTFFKGHGLGNDYLVFEAGSGWRADAAAVRAVCARHSGVGADGVVALLSGDAPFRLAMFNPDGGAFERSGNGLRIVGAHLHRTGRVHIGEAFAVEVGGDLVRMCLHGVRDGRFDISVEMGRARTGAAAVGLDARALDADGRFAGPDGTPLEVVPVSVGNPHLVVLAQGVDEARLEELGPYLVAHPALEAGANVQLAEVTGPGEAFARVWERGVGPTTASGTSACAVAVALVHTGRARPGALRVRMPGGDLHVEVTEELDVTLRGPVEAVMEGVWLGHAR